MMKLFLFVLAYVLHLSESITIDDGVFLNLVNTVTNLQQEVQELKHNLPKQISQLELNRCKNSKVDDLLAKVSELETKQNEIPAKVMAPIRTLQKQLDTADEDQALMIGFFHNQFGSLKEKMMEYLVEINEKVDEIPSTYPTLENITLPSANDMRIACTINNWSHQGKQGYHVGYNIPNLDYDTADKYCKSIGAHLPYINMKTRSDREIIEIRMGLLKSFFWIGLTRSLTGKDGWEDEGVWRWEDGTMADKEAIGFGEDQPSGVFEHDSKIKEDCIINWPPSHIGMYHLNDFSCDMALQDKAKYPSTFNWQSYGTAALCEFDCK